MSQFDDDSPFSEEEMREMFGEPLEQELFEMSVVNTRTLTKTKAEFLDETGQVVPVKEVVTKLVDYMDQKLSDADGNQLLDEIMPLMSQLLGSGLPKLLGSQMSAFYLMSFETRHAMAYMMCLSFLTLKFIESKHLKINTISEKISPEDIPKMNVRSSPETTSGSHLLEEVLDEIVKRGILPLDTLEQLIARYKK